MEEEVKKETPKEEAPKEAKPEEGKELDSIKSEAKRLLESKAYTAEEIVEIVEEALGLHDEEGDEDEKSDEEIGKNLWGM